MSEENKFVRAYHTGTVVETTISLKWLVENDWHYHKVPSEIIQFINDCIEEEFTIKDGQPVLDIEISLQALELFLQDKWNEFYTNKYNPVKDMYNLKGAFEGSGFYAYFNRDTDCIHVGIKND